MSNDPAFLFYPGDYLRDTQCLSDAARAAYDAIMCQHMNNICISQTKLKLFTKNLTDEQREELMDVLTEVGGEGYQIAWVAASICKRRDYSESRRKNRQKNKKETGYEKHTETHEKHTETHEKDMKNTSSDYVQHMENENENVNVNEIRNEDENFSLVLSFADKPAEVPIVQELKAMYLATFPHYPFSVPDDSPPLLQLVYLIGKLKRMPKHEVLEKGRLIVKIEFQKILDFVKPDPWFSGRSLSDLVKEWPRLINKMFSSNEINSRSNSRKIPGKPVLETDGFADFGQL
ncbi:MAG: hypothetical protein M9904_02185 [Chitinophagaceae bacterium]|nr:hypothetical protein [Chitinophagaceae bacterium]